MPVHGIIGKKIGTTQMFREDGRADAVTVIQAGPCTVTQVKTEDTDGYVGVQLGYEEAKSLNRPEAGHLKGVDKNFQFLREFGVDDVSEVELGQAIDVSLFSAGDLIDATADSKGRGFQGGVKRYNFRGGPKTHGQSDRHRAPGSVGAGSTPGKVIKGLRMAGHMGSQRVTVRKLEVIEADTDRNLIFIKGAVPGSRNSLVLLKRSGSRKRKLR
ncbi:MAG: 50S ribosomal protein L3 [Dehalococcoidia bacterium]|nr:50S ribosomal protein L3 [Dehalococcoidia bacterium]